MKPKKTITYRPTASSLKLTSEQEELMIQAINSIENGNPLKKSSRWKFWFRQIWDAGYQKGKEDEEL